MSLRLPHVSGSNHIYRTSFSKIGTCYTNFILPQIFTKKVVTANV